MVLFTENGAVPVATVDATESADTVPDVVTGLLRIPVVKVDALDEGVNADARRPFRNSEFRFPTSVVLLTENGAVPVVAVDVSVNADTSPAVSTGRAIKPDVRLVALA